MAAPNKSSAKKGQMGVKDAEETLDEIPEDNPDAQKRKRDREMMEQRRTKDLENAKKKGAAKI